VDPKPFEQFLTTKEYALKGTHQEGFPETAGPGKEKWVGFFDQFVQ
jgi:hypothetical protein